MVFGKKKTPEEERAKKVEEARKILQEDAERQKAEGEPTPTIEAKSNDAPPAEQVKPMEISKEEVEKLKADVDYFQKHYLGMYMPQDFAEPGVVQCNLLFGILSEIRALREAIEKLEGK